jgi:hypothetical protein
MVKNAITRYDLQNFIEKEITTKHTKRRNTKSHKEAAQFLCALCANTQCPPWLKKSPVAV